MAAYAPAMAATYHAPAFATAYSGERWRKKYMFIRFFKILFFFLIPAPAYGGNNEFNEQYIVV